ncbi:hypothetical protein DFH29DRAFT_881838 [Suillus ampliporus]|nr:hypothetical protein DFH29DRAFT_881838 [Suillus ampliporus]
MAVASIFLKFTAKDYSSVYFSMVVELKKIMKHAYHGPKLTQQLHKWATEGWAQSCKLDSKDTSKHQWYNFTVCKADGEVTTDTPSSSSWSEITSATGGRKDGQEGKADDDKAGMSQVEHGQQQSSATRGAQE